MYCKMHLMSFTVSFFNALQLQILFLLKNFHTVLIKSEDWATNVTKNFKFIPKIQSHSIYILLKQVKLCIGVILA